MSRGGAISVIVIATSPVRAAAAQRTVRDAFEGEDVEVITTAGAASPAAGASAAAARAGGDIVAIMRDDTEILSVRTGESLRRALAAFDIAGVAGTTRLVSPGWFHAGPPWLYGQMAHINGVTGEVSVILHQAPAALIPGMCALDGSLLAVRRSVFEKVRFDAVTFPREHLFDTDFTFAAHLAGFSLGVTTEVHVATPIRRGPDPAWEQDAAKFWAKHGKRIATRHPRAFQLCTVQCASRDEARALMATAATLQPLPVA